MKAELTLLVIERLVALRPEARAERVAWRAGRQRRPGLDGVMADVDDRTARRTPLRDQREAVRVHRAVPAARPGRFVEALLHVDRQEHGAVEVEGHDRQLNGATAPAHKKTMAV